MACKCLVVKNQVLERPLLDRLSDKTGGAVHRGNDLCLASLQFDRFRRTVSHAYAAPQTDIRVDPGHPSSLLLLFQLNCQNRTDLRAFPASDAFLFINMREIVRRRHRNHGANLLDACSASQQQPQQLQINAGDS